MLISYTVLIVEYYIQFGRSISSAGRQRSVYKHLVTLDGHTYSWDPNWPGQLMSTYFQLDMLMGRLDKIRTRLNQELDWPESPLHVSILPSTNPAQIFLMSGNKFVPYNSLHCSFDIIGIVAIWRWRFSSGLIVFPQPEITHTAGFVFWVGGMNLGDGRHTGWTDALSIVNIHLTRATHVKWKLEFSFSIAISAKTLFESQSNCIVRVIKNFTHIYARW